MNEHLAEVEPWRALREMQQLDADDLAVRVVVEHDTGHDLPRLHDLGIIQPQYRASACSSTRIFRDNPRVASEEGCDDPGRGLGAVRDYPQHTIAMLRDATQAMLEVLIDSVQFNDFWCLDCLFNPPDLDLSLDQHRARVAE